MKYFTTVIFALLSISLVSNAESLEKFKELKDAALQGNADAQMKIGATFFSLENPTPKQYETAIYFFLKAAEQGHAYAQFMLGYMNYHGHGIPENKTSAIEWYQKAAEKNIADA